MTLKIIENQYGRLS